MTLIKLTSLKNDGKVILLENSKVNKRTFLHNIDSCAAVIALIEAEDALHAPHLPKGNKPIPSHQSLTTKPWNIPQMLNS